MVSDVSLDPRHLACRGSAGGVGQPGGLRVLRDVAGGVAEEARTRGFASLSLGRFAFVVKLSYTPVISVLQQ